MIIANGVDLETIERFGRYQSAEDPFIKKVFTLAEAKYCFAKASPAESLAARFAAKEAIVKAFGGLEITLKIADIEIIKRKNGSVEAKIIEPKEETLSQYDIVLSMSHTDSLAIAFCVISSKDGEEN
jgi:holo-[acyl-carrier protein] synthase